MNDRVRITVSGIRGKVPQSLNVDIASKFASAFASYLDEGRVAGCRDSRFSSHMLEMAVCSSVLAAGLDYIDFGLLPTPFLQFLMKREPFSGGVSISGGHNPLPWNAVVLLNEEGAYLEPFEGSEVFNIYESGDFKKASWKNLGAAAERDFPVELYLKEMSKWVNVQRIRESSFKVVGDLCNGAISPFIGVFGEFFNCKLVTVNDDLGKPFPHPPEPSIEHAGQVEAVVKATDADIGFLINSDSSRISFVSEKGKGLSEELTLPLCIFSLQGKISKVMTTVATSSWADWAAGRIGIDVHKTKVGQSAVIHMMGAENAEVGGEGSGSVAFSPFSSGYDALLSLAFLLDLMSKEGKRLSEIMAPFPEYYMEKCKIEVPPEMTYKVMDKLEKVYAKESPDFTDGIRVERKCLWFNIRPSTTEFILRLILEGETESLVKSAKAEIIERIEE
ncbi:MAG: hypothetical protein IBX60_01890 [Candidatus Aminicenantes bacterium]|nr:hypothetical protein [Candidatus Aminicenantes bacterium]